MCRKCLWGLQIVANTIQQSVKWSSVVLQPVLQHLECFDVYRLVSSTPGTPGPRKASPPDWQTDKCNATKQTTGTARQAADAAETKPDEASQTDGQQIGHWSSEHKEINSSGPGAQCLGPRKTMFGTKRAIVGVHAGDQWLESNKQMAGAQETKGWGPGNQWLWLRKQMVGVQEMNGRATGILLFESRK